MLLACSLLGVIPTVCGAQDQPVQPGVADTDPLGESLRRLSPSLRIDNNFEHVYRLDPTDRNSPFFRRAGGLYAVFPHSQYVLTREGVVAAVPPGTVYHFGRPETRTAATASASDSGSISGGRLRDSGASDLRYVGRQSQSVITPDRLDRTAAAMREREAAENLPIDGFGADEPTGLLTRREGVMSDESYRARRLAQIVARHTPPPPPHTPGRPAKPRS